MEQFSPLLGLSSRVTENCDGDMLIRSGKPSSGIRRQVVTGPLLTCPLSHDVQPSETTTASYAGELLFYSTLILLAPVQRILDGITSTASRATLAKNRFWNTPSSPSPQSYTFIRTLSLSLALFLSIYTNIFLVCLDVRWRVSLVEKHRWRRYVVVRFVRIERIPHYDEKRYDDDDDVHTFDLTIMIAAQQTLLEEQRYIYTHECWQPLVYWFRLRPLNCTYSPYMWTCIKGEFAS